MIIKIDNIESHPFKEFDLFIKQLDNRRDTIESLINNYDCIKLVFKNEDYVLITPAFTKKHKYQITYFNFKNEPLSHSNHENIKSVLEDSYTREDYILVEVM